jgi:hypothetical protein
MANVLLESTEDGVCCREHRRLGGGHLGSCRPKRLQPSSYQHDGIPISCAEFISTKFTVLAVGVLRRSGANTSSSRGRFPGGCMLARLHVSVSYFWGYLLLLKIVVYIFYSLARLYPYITVHHKLGFRARAPEFPLRNSTLASEYNN